MNENDVHEYEPLERRLRGERAELTAIELDRVKRSAMAGAARGGGRRMTLKARLVTGALLLGLIGTGGGAVLAASGGSSSNGSSANSQYCPPSSPGAGKPKHQGGGNKCGHPEDGGGGGGNGGGNGNGNGGGNGGGGGGKGK
jgi:hypothetical protein